MSDEEIIKRRLLFDGDGTGDDRRLNVLLKTFTKWCNSTDTPENEQITSNRMLAQLAQSEYAIVKSGYTSKMMKEELKNYKKISANMDLAIEQTRKEIDQSKANLVLAKKIRKNETEYDLLTKIISRQPDRRETAEQLELLKEELSELQSNRHQLETKMEIRKKDFAVLMRSITKLQNELDVDEDVKTLDVTDLDMEDENSK